MLEDLLYNTADVYISFAMHFCCLCLLPLLQDNIISAFYGTLCTEKLCVGHVT